LAWYTEGLGHASDCRRLIFQTRAADEVWEVFERYWERPGPDYCDRPRPAISHTASTLSPRMA